MTGKVLGVNSPYLAMLLHQNRRRFVLRKLRNLWYTDLFLLKLTYQQKWLRDYFSFDRRYQYIRQLTEHEQQRGRV
ncbi:hypothetical protein Xvie_04067 [Xenorhabdus vietnamensis]|uniref:Uncharacterized protein n=1 Tax=Xenorhabdus vietnamensis TaxID=351656 RepID=A0A1Y2S5U5_9GAMM|nr:hypothetical protein [Xenorhabdus vietnamensis]OTA14016.1 hypothetical protein Xvie_04067 [Xenorhabdus vietnamensis]